uniref:ARAD1B20482p n=1 Tax=Blastobotrys adeninivorans TaxID=409370 RepID=A0A060TD16_BLAAD
MEEQLRTSVNNVLVAAGHLLMYLNADTAQKVIPNPRGVLQGAVDAQVRNCHRILDEINMEVQSAQAAIRMKQKTAVKQEQPKPTGNDDDELIELGQNVINVEAIDNDDSKTQQNGQDTNTNNDDNEAKGFDMQMDGFDDDLNALLDTVGEDKIDSNADMGGLFGDDFDFIIPDQ